MHAGKTSEGFDLLSGIRVGDLTLVQSSKRPDRIVSRVQSIIEQHPDPQAREALLKRREADEGEFCEFGELFPARLET
jgi:hypothetical protein